MNKVILSELQDHYIPFSTSCFFYLLKEKGDKIVYGEEREACREIICIPITVYKRDKMGLRTKLKGETVLSPMGDFLFALQSDKGKKLIDNIEKLWEKEEQANVVPTEISETQFRDVWLIRASGAWKQSVWKASLYLLYIKNLLGLTDIECYVKNLYRNKNNEGIFLSHINEETGEFFIGASSNYHTTAAAGIDSIMTGGNERMRELLKIERI